MIGEEREVKRGDPFAERLVRRRGKMLGGRKERPRAREKQKHREREIALHIIE